MVLALEASAQERSSTWHRWHLFLALGLLLLPLVGCMKSSPTPQAVLTYEGPQTYTLKPGDWLPGTNIRFLQRTPDGAEFLIGNQRTLKQVADSLVWNGSPAAGVQLELGLRIVWFTDEALYAVGTAKVTISDVAPQAAVISTQAPLSYAMPVAYTVDVGGMAPGSTLRYEGQGPDGARFGGVDGYPFRRLGDSVRWEGTLRSGVSIRLDLRVLQYDAQAARLGGVAHLWVKP